MKNQNAIFLFLLFELIIGCNSADKNDPPFFKANSSIDLLNEDLKNLSQKFDLVLVHKVFNEIELRNEYRVLARNNQQWTKILYYSDSENSFLKKREVNLSEVGSKIILLSLQQYHLFDIETMDVLLKRHKELCGSPFDPSHYLTFELLLISGKDVRRLHFDNPGGRYEMCPAIKNWDNAFQLNKIFVDEWREDKWSGTNPSRSNE